MLLFCIPDSPLVLLNMARAVYRQALSLRRSLCCQCSNLFCRFFGLSYLLLYLDPQVHRDDVH
ncbi:hypothetical protein ACF8J8_01975 [Klebsiella pneumoniae]